MTCYSGHRFNVGMLDTILKGENMAKFKIDDGLILNTEKAVKSWNEDTRWNGNNHISVQTGSQWIHETLYKSSKGKYYKVHDSQYQGDLSYATILTDEEAATWLLSNGDELPEDLMNLEAELEE